MLVNVSQYWAAIGVFNNPFFMISKKHYYFSETSNMKNNFLFTTTINGMVVVFICFMFKAFLTKKIGNIGLDWLLYLSYFSLFMLFICLIKISGDVEENPGPKHYSAQYLTICHWNLNSIAAHNFIKVVLLKSLCPWNRYHISFGNISWLFCSSWWW